MTYEVDRFNKNRENMNEIRRKALTRFAINFLIANLGELEADGFFEAFDPVPTEEELEKLKQHLGVQFS